MVVCIYMCVCVCEREYVWSKISTGIEGKWKDARKWGQGIGRSSKSYMLGIIFSTLHVHMYFYCCGTLVLLVCQH